MGFPAFLKDLHDVVVMVGQVYKNSIGVNNDKAVEELLEHLVHEGREDG